MFIWSLLLTIGIVTTCAIRYGFFFNSNHSRSHQKSLRKVAVHISLQEWEMAERSLYMIKRTCKDFFLFEIEILKGKKNWQEALARTESASRMFPEELLFRLHEATILLELDRPKEALDAFHVCGPILRKEHDLLSLASAFCKAGYHQEALTILHDLSSTENGYMAELIGDAHYELNHFSDAIHYYKQAIILNRTSHRLFLQLAHAYRRYGNLAEAEKIFRDLLHKDHYDVEATLGLGACLQERGQYFKAFLVYQTALSYSSKDLKVIYQAAFVALKAKKYDFSEKYFFEILQHQKDDPQLYVYYGYSLEMQHKWLEAEKAYLSSIEQFPAYCPGYRALGWLYAVGLSQTISSELALHYGHVALKLKNDSLSWEILSALFARVGDFDKAYQIQQLLAKQDKSTKEQLRRQDALRCLRKKMALGHLQVARAHVA